MRRIFIGQKLLTLLMLIVCIQHYFIDQSFAGDIESQSSPNANNSARTINRHFYITPYLGSSTLVGNLGIEFQYKHYGYNLGILRSLDVAAIDNILCGGIRYYRKPCQHSWVIGLGGGVVLDDLKPDDNLCGEWSGDKPDNWVCETGTVIDKYIGVLIGYRWIWRNKVRLNIGAGPNYIKWKTIRKGDQQKYLPMLELVIGYSF